MTETHPFISYLESLAEDRGTLAALRRGLGQPPGAVPGMYRYVVPWLAEEAPAWREEAYFTIAALYAYHPLAGGTGNMGQHYARARNPQGDDTALERRFTALLSAHQDDLAFYLRQAISFLRSKDIPVDWHQLLADYLAWGHLSRYVQRNWARAFWGRPAREEQNTEEE